MKHAFASCFALVGMSGLPACGAASGGDDFASRLISICVSERGEGDRKECECASKVIDEALSRQDRDLATLSMDAEEGRFKTRDDARKAMSSIGLNPDNSEEIMGGFIQRMMILESTAGASCNVS